MRSIAIRISIYALLVFFVSCRKDKHEDDNKPAGIPVLTVKLSAPYLASGLVDSAFATWKINGQENRFRMMVRNDSLIAGLAQFEEGNGELSIQVFTQKKYSNQYYGQWVAKKNISLKRNKSLSYQGPISFYDPAWFPRVELKDAIGHEAIVALRPDDAYFMIRTPNHQVVRYRVDRGYWKTVGGIEMAGRALWECTTGCTDIADENFFKVLPGRIGQKPWNHISIAILFEINDDGEGWIVSLEHEP